MIVKTLHLSVERRKIENKLKDELSYLLNGESYDRLEVGKWISSPSYYRFRGQNFAGIDRSRDISDDPRNSYLHIF